MCVVISVPGCGLPVSHKAGGAAYVKRNPMIADVVSSFKNIEQIMGES